jgi:hypothetical protein
MTDSQIRQKIIKMTRNQLEHAFIKLSRSRQPSDEQMGSIMNGFDLTPGHVPPPKPVRSMDDQILDFGMQLRAYDMEKDAVRATERGEECMIIIKNILAEVLGDVLNSLQGQTVDVEEGSHLSTDSVLRLYDIANLLVECNTKVDGNRWRIRMLVELGRAMVTFTAASTSAGLAMPPMQSRLVTKIITSMDFYVQDLEAHTQGLVGEGGQLNDFVTALTLDPSRDEDEPTMPLTMENLNRLSGDDNYRTQKQQPPPDTPSHYQDHYSVVSDDLATEGENFRPEAMARWAGLDWNGGNHDDDDYSDDERLSYNSDYQSPWH